MISPDMTATTVEKVQAIHSQISGGREKADYELDATGEDCLEADMYFLKPDELWETEKPYGMRYHADGIPQSNVRREKHKIILKDIRRLEKTPSVDMQGFSVMPLDSRMAYEDFRDYSKIKSIYHADINIALKKTLGARHVFVMDNAVRRREAHFPISQGRNYEWDQPTAMSHIDFTRDEAIRMLTTLYGKRAPEVLDARWQVINVWKPLRGPLRDWPLGLVDARTVDFKNDTVPADVVFPTWVTENMQVMHNPNYQWYHLSDQMPNEALIFKSADSEDSLPCACPHAGFYNSKIQTTDLPRESIDCRAFVLYADLDEYPEEVGRLFEGVHGHMV